MTILYFIIILSLTIFIHELGHFIFAKKNGVYCYEFSLGMGPKIYSFKRRNKNDETTYSIRLFPIGGFVQMAGEEIEEDKNIPANKRMQSKTIWQRFKIVVAGAMNNFLLGILLLFLMSIIFGSPETKPYVGEVDKSYNAYKVNVREGDLILKINNKRVYTIDDVLLQIELLKDGDSVKLSLRDTNENIKSVTIVPIKEESNKETKYVYGFSLSSQTNKGLFSSIKYSFVEFMSMFRSMVNVVGNLFIGRLGLKSLSGPVGIYNIVDQQSKMGFQNIMYLTAYLSINIGFVNLIPFPAFDGGRALFLIIEKFRKKPINPRIENIIHFVGFILLMILVSVVTIQDIIKLL
jgi:regulator of sigma E protease